MATVLGPHRIVFALLSLALLTEAYPGHRGASNLQLGQYAPPGPGDNRSPCPAFNTMANHGVFPRNGSAIRIPVIIEAFNKFFGFSRSFVRLMATGALALGVGDPLKGTIDLVQLRAHNKIEHDVSLVRDDFALGNNYLVNNTLVEQLIATSKDNATISLRDVGLYRRARFGFCKSTNPTFRFGIKQEGVAFGEASFFLLPFANVSGRGSGSGPRVPIAVTRQFLQQERYPDGFKPARRRIGLQKVGPTAAALKVIAGLKS